MKKIGYKKIVIIAAALFLIFAPVGLAQNSPALSPTHAYAQNSTGGGATVQKPSPFTCAANAATCGVYYVALIANGLMALFISVGAFTVRLSLQFNDNIFTSPAVQTGYSVSLAIANLGFVLGIIIIAIATIIRNQTYGMKQLLWKLVLMAILVNFGLVIAGPIVGFASSMSNYFINAISPSAATGGYEGFVTKMTGAFQPQVITTGSGSAASSAACATLPGIGSQTICDLAVNVATSLSGNDSFWQMTMALLFDVAFSGLTVFVFWCLAILLIVRYLILGGLLIVLPLAWLTYVFPKFDNSFSKWWNEFVKWVFFPPIALFFLYLAFTTATNATAAGTTYLNTAAAIPPGAAQGVEASIYEQTGITGGIQQTADEILLLGLTVMGLMFANSLSGKAGKATVGAVSGGSKAFGTWVGKSGRRAAYSAAARVTRPRTRIDPLTGGEYSPLTGPRANVTRWLSGRAQRTELNTPGTGFVGKTTGLAGAVWGGAKKGSGLFKNKNEAHDWECQNCHVTQRSTKKPTFACPNCHVAPAVAKWTQV